MKEGKNLHAREQMLFHAFLGYIQLPRRAQLNYTQPKQQGLVLFGPFVSQSENAMVRQKALPMCANSQADQVQSVLCCLTYCVDSSMIREGSLWIV